jgi:uncharacterized protein YjdB
MVLPSPLAARAGRRTGAAQRPPATLVLLAFAAAVLLAFAAAGCASAIPEGPPQAVTSVIVAPDSPTLVVGDSVQLTAVAMDAGGVLVPNATFTWKSSNAAMASVSATGMVKALTPGGPVNITATAGSGVGLAVLNDTTVTP